MAQHALWDLVPAHHNNQLFSDHYLNERLPKTAQWRELGGEAAGVLEGIRSLRRSFTPTKNEAQLEEEYIRPILKLLGHRFIVQPTLRAGAYGTKRPDYVLFASASDVDRAKSIGILDEEQLAWANAILVGDAKAWNRPLDVAVDPSKAPNDEFTNRNPSFQISFYVQHSGLPWGFLTNGVLWRLYHTSSAHKLDRYYEVNLEELLAAGGIEQFLYFYAFFRPAAFTAPPGLTLDGILEESTEYARNVGESLKEQVYAALEHLAQGFLDRHPDTLSTAPGALGQIYSNCLILLYRLLFVLYAESRGLLPIVDNKQYKEQYSLLRLRRAIAEHAGSGSGYLPGTQLLWSHLQTLFGLIDQGSSSLGIGAFNGRLFSDAYFPFLADHQVGDARLQRALDLLSRVDNVFIDYRDLSVRHLGSIYEGLLEHHLEALDQPSRTARAGTFVVGLRNEAGERRSTGSYYTPDEVVKYIVEQTLNPLLERIAQEPTSEDEKAQAVLELNVVDPAMGSGHFLVEVTEHIARYLVSLGVTGESTPDENDLLYWKRRVVQSCVYGVDLNPLAVELAKLSLWLITASRDKPLSFLDHHLRPGNALLGLRMEDLRQVVPRKRRKKKAHHAAHPSFWTDEEMARVVGLAVDLMQHIEETPSDTLDDIKEQEVAYEKLRRHMRHAYGVFADVLLSTAFGHPAPDSWPAIMEFAQRPSEAPPTLRRWINRGLAIASRYSFFHWELEFPEVYFTAQGRSRGSQSGFDAVVGNPPYVNAMELNRVLTEYEKPLWKEQFSSAFGAYDIYVLFIEQALRQCRKGCLIGLITPNKYLAAPYAAALRTYLVENHQLVRLYDLSRVRVFEEAATYPVISVWRSGPSVSEYGFTVEVVESPAAVRHYTFSSTMLHLLPDLLWSYLTTTGASILPRIVARSRRLEEIADVNAATTAAEQDAYTGSIVEEHMCSDYWKVANTGVIERYASLWGYTRLTHGGRNFSRPVLPRACPAVSAYRRAQYDSPKLIFAKISHVLEAMVDADGLYAGVNVNFAVPKTDTYDVYMLSAICNSPLMSWIYRRYFGALTMSGGYMQVQAPQLRVLPIARVSKRIDAKLLAHAHQLAGLDGAERNGSRYVELMYGAAFPKDRPPRDISGVCFALLRELGPLVKRAHDEQSARRHQLKLDLVGLLSPAAPRKLARLWEPPVAPKSDTGKAFKAHKALLKESQDTLGTHAKEPFTLEWGLVSLQEHQWQWCLKNRLGTISNFADLVVSLKGHASALSRCAREIADLEVLAGSTVCLLYGLSADDVAELTTH